MALSSSSRFVFLLLFLTIFFFFFSFSSSRFFFFLHTLFLFFQFLFYTLQLLASMSMGLICWVPCHISSNSANSGLSKPTKFTYWESKLKIIQVIKLFSQPTPPNKKSTLLRIFFKLTHNSQEKKNGMVGARYRATFSFCANKKNLGLGLRVSQRMSLGLTQPTILLFANMCTDDRKNTRHRAETHNAILRRNPKIKMKIFWRLSILLVFRC
jgi:hypothetical protein